MSGACQGISKGSCIGGCGISGSCYLAAESTCDIAYKGCFLEEDDCSTDCASPPYDDLCAFCCDGSTENVNRCGDCGGFCDSAECKGEAEWQNQAICEYGSCGRRSLLKDATYLVKDSSYDPTPKEALEIAEEFGGDLDAGFILEKTLLTEEECALLVAYTDETKGIKYRSNENDKIIMARDKSPLEDIIGVDSTKELYKFYKDNTDGAPITQVWLRRITGEDTYMGLHTDKQLYQMKIALNSDYEGGDFLMVDHNGAKSIKFETGEGFLHDKGLVHGHMPHTGDVRTFTFVR